MDCEAVLFRAHFGQRVTAEGGCDLVERQFVFDRRCKCFWHILCAAYSGKYGSYRLDYRHERLWQMLCARDDPFAANRFGREEGEEVEQIGRGGRLFAQRLKRYIPCGEIGRASCRGRV